MHLCIVSQHIVQKIYKTWEVLGVNFSIMIATLQKDFHKTQDVRDQKKKKLPYQCLSGVLKMDWKTSTTKSLKIIGTAQTLQLLLDSLLHICDD